MPFNEPRENTFDYIINNQAEFFAVYGVGPQILKDADDAPMAKKFEWTMNTYVQYWGRHLKNPDTWTGDFRSFCNW